MAIVGILGFGYWRENIARGQETVAVIFGERVTTGDLAERVRPTLAAYDRRLAALNANGLSQQAGQLQLQRGRLPEQALNNLIEDRVVRREAAARGISVTDADIDEQFRQLVAEADQANLPQPTPTAAPTSPPGTTPTPSATPAGTLTPVPTATPVPTLTEDRYGPALQEYLSNTGYTEGFVRREIESNLYQDKLRAAIGEAEVPAVQEQVHARHLVLATEDDANQALQQLQGGASFEELAASRSTDQATKDKGGDLGWLPRKGQDEAFDQAAFALQPGQTSPVVQTLNGWEIIQVLERDPARPVPPDLLDQLRRERFGNWLAAAEGDPGIERDLSPQESEWILKRAGGGATGRA